jgi:transposase
MMRAIKPYSEDLRTRRIVRSVEGGSSKSAAARLFGVSLSSVKRYARMAHRGGSLAPRRRAEEGPRRPTGPHPEEEVALRGRQGAPYGYRLREASLLAKHHG